MEASTMTGIYRTHTIMMEGHMFPNNSPASEAFVVGIDSDHRFPEKIEQYKLKSM